MGAFLLLVLFLSIPQSKKTIDPPLETETEIDPTPVQSGNDLFIHPQCLEFLGPWNKEHSDTFECSDYDLSIVKQNDNNVSASYGDRQSIHYSYPAKSGSASAGRDFRLLEVEIRSGGSGIFSSIVLLERDRLNLNKYTVWVRTPDGDRCNDGKKWVSKSTSDSFELKAAATPFRLINPHGTTDWRNWYLASEVSKLDGKDLERPPMFNEWLPYDDVVNSANACVGWVVRKYDYETGFEIIGVELNPNLQIELKSDGASLSSCINGWLGSQSNEEGSYIRIDDWTSQLRQLTNICGVASLMN